MRFSIQSKRFTAMSEVFGTFDPQAFVVLVVALIGVVPVALYYVQTPGWFVIAFGCLLVAAVATNIENVVLPDVLNFTEHIVGNMGAGIAFAVAAYMYRRETITSDDTEAQAG